MEWFDYCAPDRDNICNACRVGYFKSTTDGNLCPPCRTTCPPGTQIDVQCTVLNRTADNPCNVCPAGKYQSDVSNKPCAPCVTACGPGFELVGTCTATTTPVCVPCATNKFKSLSDASACQLCKTSCPAGNYRIGVCNGGANDYDCVPCYTCPTGFTRTDGCTGTTTTPDMDRQCADLTLPVITLLGATTITVEAGTTFSDPGATVFDSTLDVLSVQVTSPVPSSLKPAGFITPTTYTIVYSARDNNGNDAINVTRTVIIDDTTPPVIALVGPADVYIEVGATYVDLGAVAFDSLEGNITARIVRQHNIITTLPTIVPHTFTVTYDVTDLRGNAAAQVVRHVHVVDTTPPVVTLRGGASVETEAAVDYADQGATAVDSYEGDISVRIGASSELLAEGGPAAPLSCATAADGVVVPARPVSAARGPDSAPGVNVYYPSGTQYGITYTVTDSNGNVHAAKRLLTLRDNTPPVVVLRGSSTPKIDYRRASADTVYTDAGADASDALDGVLTGSLCVTVAKRSGGATIIEGRPLSLIDASAPLGTEFVVTYSAQDYAGNVGRAQRVITVVDVSAPVLTLVGDAAVQLIYGIPFVDPGATANDVHDGDAPVRTYGAVDPYTAGTYTLTYASRDTAGNDAVNVTRIVTVAELDPPSAAYRYILELGQTSAYVTTRARAFEAALSAVSGARAFILSISEAPYEASPVLTYVEVALRATSEPYDWLPSENAGERLDADAISAQVPAASIFSSSPAITPPPDQTPKYIGAGVGGGIALLLLLYVLYMLHRRSYIVLPCLKKPPARLSQAHRSIRLTFGKQVETAGDDTYGDARALAASRVLSPVSAGKAVAGPAAAAGPSSQTASSVKANPVFARPIETPYEPAPTPYYTVPAYFAPPTLRRESQPLAVIDSQTDDSEYGFTMPAFDMSVYASIAAKALPQQETAAVAQPPSAAPVAVAAEAAPDAAAAKNSKQRDWNAWINRMRTYQANTD